jgi:hypothetical protein
MSKYLTLEEYMIINNHTFVHFSLIILILYVPYSLNLLKPKVLNIIN